MSTIVTDTITGKSTATTITIGSTPVVSASANSMTIRGEGSAQTSIQQGLCKMWARLNGQGTIALDDSFNVGSTTDEGTGQYTYTFSNNMSNANFNVAHASGNQMQIHSLSATSSVRTLNRDGSNNNEDANPAFSNVHGDLA